MVINRPNSVKPNIRGRKLRSGVNLQGVLKQTDVKQKLYSHQNLTVGVIESSQPEGVSNRKWESGN
jgi:hypothetical protein